MQQSPTDNINVAYDEVGAARMLATEANLFETNWSDTRISDHLLRHTPAQVDQLQLDADLQRKILQLRQSVA